MNDEKRCCGTCIWHKQESIDSGYVCVNDRSDYLSDWTEYEDCCEEWEGKGNDTFYYYCD